MLRSARSTSCLIALFIGGLVACDGDPSVLPNVLPWVDATTTSDTTDPGDAAGPGDTGGGACDCLAVGTWYRFDSMVLETIGGGDHPVIGTLNALWAADMAKAELNIFFQLTAVSADTLEFRAMNAARRTDTTSEVCLLPSTEASFTMPREGCTIKDSAESSISVYAGSVDNPKNCSTVLPVPHAIPVDRAVIRGEFDPSCEAVSSGVVVGGTLGETALEQVCACLLLGDELAETCGALDPEFEGDCPGCNDSYQPLSALLNAFGPVNFDCESSTGDPATCITGLFTASRWDMPIEDCD